SGSGPLRYLHSFPTRRSSDLSLASRSTAREPTSCWRSAAAALFDSRSAARSVIASGCSPCALRGVHSGSLGAVTRLRFDNTETRSEEHTSELQSLTNLVCRLL